MTVSEAAELTRRFSREALVKGIGEEGVRRLRSSRVAVIGCGALGSTEAELLARSGVGFIRVVDRDVVDYTNLHRTHMVGEADAEQGTPKATACRDGVINIDRSIKVEAIIDDVDSDNVEDIIRDVDIILDGTDNMETRFLINEAAVKHDKPWVYAGVNSWYGTVMFIEPGRGACLRCLMPEGFEGRQASCDVIPAIGTVTTMVGSIAANLAVRYLAGDRPEPGVLYSIDAREGSIEKIRVERNPQCPVCVMGRYDMLARRPALGLLTRVCGSEAFKLRLTADAPSPEELSSRLASRFSWLISRSNYVKVITKEGVTVTVLGRRVVVIEGAANEDEARKAYNEVAEAAGMPVLVDAAPRP